MCFEFRYFWCRGAQPARRCEAPLTRIGPMASEIFLIVNRSHLRGPYSPSPLPSIFNTGTKKVSMNTIRAETTLIRVHPHQKWSVQPSHNWRVLMGRNQPLDSGEKKSCNSEYLQVGILNFPAVLFQSAYDGVSRRIVQIMPERLAVCYPYRMTDRG